MAWTCLAGLPLHRTPQRLAARAGSLSARHGGHAALDGRHHQPQLPTCALDGEHVVRAVDRSRPDLAIDRENEYRNSEAAAESRRRRRERDGLPAGRGRARRAVRWRADVHQDDVWRHARPAAHRRGLPPMLHDGPALRRTTSTCSTSRRATSRSCRRGAIGCRHGTTTFAEQVGRIRVRDAARAGAGGAVQQRPAGRRHHRRRRAAVADRLRVLRNDEASFELGNIWSESALPDDALDARLVHGVLGPTTGRREGLRGARRGRSCRSTAGRCGRRSRMRSALIEFDYWSVGDGEVRPGGAPNSTARRFDAVAGRRRGALNVLNTVPCHGLVTACVSHLAQFRLHEHTATSCPRIGAMTPGGLGRALRRSSGGQTPTQIER